MSRIYEALRTAEATSSVRSAPAGNRGVMEMTDQRRFRQAVNVSAEGALIQIRAPVCEGQELLLINNYSSKEQRCCIVRVRNNGTEMNEVGVKFPSPNPEFWNIPDPSCDLPEKPEDEGF